MKLVVVSHALVQEPPRARWLRLAETYPVEVTLLIPDYWRSRWLGGFQSWRNRSSQNGRFAIQPMPVSNHEEWGRYVYRSIDAQLRSLRPDVIFVVQEETSWILQQMILYRKLWAPQSRLIFFSWNNIYVTDHSIPQRTWWWRTRTGTDMAIAGTTEVKQVLEKAGYQKPIYVQTEVGVDEQVFKPDYARREAIRKKLGLEGFVIGFAGRLVKAKGVLDLADALDQLDPPFSVLFVGDGDQRAVLEQRAEQGGWSATFTGMVDMSDMQDYLRAMDCLVLPSRTTPDWKEQFGLVLAQAMACRVAVIGSDSGAIPEVIGDAGLIFPEGDADALRTCLRQLIADAALLDSWAERGYERCLTTYSAAFLAKETYELFAQRHSDA